MTVDSTFQSVEDYYTQRSATANSGTAPTRIVHYINPFPADPGSEHDRAQHVTLKSMQVARQVSKTLLPDLIVEHVGVVLEKDGLPEGLRFDQTATLKRTVLDMGSFYKPKELTLLFDIITALPTEPNDIVIQTNVDIAVVPHFYALIGNMFSAGTDCAVINRRTISDAYRTDADLYLMSSETGQDHPGYDCFAFRAGLLDSFEPFSSCVGIGGVDRPLLYNLLAFAKAPTVLLDAHATFHLGNDKAWKSNDFDDYYAYNLAEMHRVVDAILVNPVAGRRLVDRLQSSPDGDVITPAMRQHFGLSDPAKPGRTRRALRKLGHVLSNI